MINDRERGTLHTFENITSTENLLAAWREFVAGKRKKEDVSGFGAGLMDNILELQHDLVAGTYRHGKYVAFKISDPKPRDIHKATVRDRLLHHAVYRVLYPLFDRTWIADSFSCRDGKGTHRAMDRFRTFGNKVSRNHTRTTWVLKCDIRKFFASIDQGILLAEVQQRVEDERTRSLIAEIVGSFCAGTAGIGLPLGNLTSQVLVNVHMNRFDQWVKHRLKEKYYIRYADDFVILSDNRKHLEDILPLIAEFLTRELHLTLHPKKISLTTLASGVDFLGWVHFPDHRILRTSTKRRMAHADLENEQIKHSYRGLLAHGNGHDLGKSLGITGA